jgi:hypothetical protein
MRIDGYIFGELRIGSEVYTSDLIVLHDRVLPGWWRREGHRLLPEDLGDVVAAAPKKLVIGTGAYGAMTVPSSTLDFIRENGIEPIALRTQEACDLFNSISDEGDVAAALHLTC